MATLAHGGGEVRVTTGGRVPAHHPPGGGVHLQAPALTAGAPLPLDVHRDVPQLAGRSARARHRRAAEERVALGLIIGELVRSENLQAKPEQVKALVTETAQTYEQPEAVVRWHFEKPERLRDFEAMVLEQNVVDWIVARAKVTDEPMSFDQVMGRSPAGA